ALYRSTIDIAACIDKLRVLRISIYKSINNKTKEFVEALRRFVLAKNYKVKIFSVGSIFWIAFTDQEAIRAASDIDPASMEKYKVMHRELLNRGVYFGPSGYEVGFVSHAH